MPGEVAAEYARNVGVSVQPIKPAEIDSVLPRLPDSNGTPLWLYVLAEAQLQESSKNLGILGTRLVGEVILGTSACDRESVLHKLTGNSSKWPPIEALKKDKRYTMPALIAYLEAQSHGSYRLTLP